MELRALGRSGPRVSVAGLGCNNFGGRLDQDATTAVVDACFEHGVTFFDTADIYGNRGGSETMLGRALAGRRDEVVLATKFGMDMQGANGDDFGARGSRRYIRRAVQASLRRLQTDHLDLYQYHVPDGVTPIEETLTALHELVTDGLVRYVGSSNLPSWQVSEAAWTARDRGLTPFISEQSEYSLVRRDAERELLPACAHHGVGFLPYFPLASGLLTGKYAGGGTGVEGRLAGTDIDRGDAAVVDAVTNFARQRDVGILDVAMGALAARPEVASVIAGATRPEQVSANVAAVRWRPGVGDLDELRRALDGASAV